MMRAALAGLFTLGLLGQAVFQPTTPGAVQLQQHLHAAPKDSPETRLQEELRSLQTLMAAHPIFNPSLGYEVRLIARSGPRSAFDPPRLHFPMPERGNIECFFKPIFAFAPGDIQTTWESGLFVELQLLVFRDGDFGPAHTDPEAAPY